MARQTRVQRLGWWELLMILLAVMKNECKILNVQILRGWLRKSGLPAVIRVEFLLLR